MRTKTFEEFTINLTEKQYKALKKRFNPDNFTPPAEHLGHLKSLVNIADCLCPSIRKGPLSHTICEGCPFAFISGRGQCGYLYVRWASTLGFDQPEYKVKLGVHEIAVEDDHGIAIVTAIYQVLTSFRRVQRCNS